MLALSKYPEHDKLQKVQVESQAIGEFHDWMNEQGYNICELEGEHDRFIPIHRRIDDLMAEFFGIDRDKVEEEKRQMLDEMRNRADEALGNI